MTRPTDAASHTPESGGNVAIDPAGASTPRKLFGYDVLHYLGDGAGTRIYAVKDPVTGRSYALKHVVRTTDEDARFVEQMENEYEVSRQLSHPGLRRAVAFKTRKTLLFKTAEAALVMELFDGESLDRKLPRSDAALVACFVDTAKALYALHHAGFVHCDLKPANILCGPTGTIQVIDLGQACPIGTVKKRIQGTPDYLSPEQFELKPVTERTDAFNLGATMYWALCGQKLPTAYTVSVGKAAAPSAKLLRSPREHNPLVPEALSSLVMSCVRTDPDDRPRTMGEVVQRLDVIRHLMGQQKPRHAHAAHRRAEHSVHRVKSVAG